MPDRYQESHIRRLPMFQQLPPEQFRKVASAFHVRRYNAGEIMFQQGEPTKGMHILVDGQAVLQRYDNGHWQQVGLIRSGQSVNDAAIFDTGLETATLQATQPVTALLLTRDELANLIAYNPDVAQALGLQGQSVPHIHGIEFSLQRENEEVMLNTRRHWWAYMRFMWIPVAIMIGLWVTAAFAPLAGLWIVLSIIIPGIIGFYLWAEWINDSVIVTDQRVIRITHTILTFSEVRNEIAIESVQEANASVPSLDPFALIFRYGNVEIKTAGQQGNFILDFMPNPQKVQEIILEDRKLYDERNYLKDQQALRADIDKWIDGGQNQYTYLQGGTGSGVADAVSKQKIENMWSPGSGPASPFVTRFPTNDGAIVYRTHWGEWLGNIFMPSLSIIGAGIFLIAMLFINIPDGLGIIAFASTMVVMLIGVVWFYYADWDWRHDYYIVDDKTITIVNQRPLWLQSENDQLLLQRVDNVVAESSGIRQRLLRYGDVRVSLVGADEPKIFDNVANPLSIQDEISRRQRRLKQNQAFSEQQEQKKLLGEYFSAFQDRLQEQGHAPAAFDGIDMQQQNYIQPQQNYQQPPAYPQDNYQQQGYTMQQGDYLQSPQQQQPSQQQQQNDTPTLNDRSRPPIVPRQNRPGLSQGRPYNPNAPKAADDRINYPSEQPSPYRPQQGQQRQSPPPPPPPPNLPEQRPPKFNKGRNE